MKLTQLSCTLGIAILLASCSSTPEPSNTDVTPTSDQPSLSQSGESTILKQGDFVSAKYNTQGTGTLLTKDGKTFLELNQAFQTDQGPDLFILLHQEVNPTAYDPSQYALVGQLSRNKGQQQYEIAAEVEIEQYQSIAIWCKKFNVTFGYAPLNQ